MLNKLIKLTKMIEIKSKIITAYTKIITSFNAIG
jgi:hypothetical protein